MGMTEKQAFVLENLDRIVVRGGGRQSKYSLDGHDCRARIASLAVQGLVAWDGKGKPSRIGRPKSPDAGAEGERDGAPASVPGRSDVTLALVAG